MVGRKSRSSRDVAEYRGHLMTMLKREVRSKLEEPDRLSSILRRRKEVIIEAPEEEDEPEEAVEPVMTKEDKKALVTAVKDGDQDLVTKLLAKPAADINMSWYNENLLMVAIRAGQEKMAEFLVTNGIERKLFSLELTPSEGRDSRVDAYYVPIRQMAYDAAMWDLVELIDDLDGTLWSFIKRPPRSSCQQKEAAYSGKPVSQVKSEADVPLQCGRKAMSNRLSSRISSTTSTSRRRVRSAASVSTRDMTFSDLDDTVSILTCATHNDDLISVDAGAQNDAHHRYKSTRSAVCRSQSVQDRVSSKTYRPHTASPTMKYLIRGKNRETDISQTKERSYSDRYGQLMYGQGLQARTRPGAYRSSHPHNWLHPLLAVGQHSGLSHTAATLAHKYSYDLLSDFNTVAGKMESQPTPTHTTAIQEADVPPAVTQAENSVHTDPTPSKHKPTCKRKPAFAFKNANAQYATMNHTYIW